MHRPLLTNRVDVEHIYIYYSYLQIFNCILCTNIQHTHVLMQYTWGSHGGLATLTLAHINVQKIVFVWSVNPAKKTADSPPLSGAGCQKKKKNQEAS